MSPWDAKSFMKHKEGMSKRQASMGAKIANGILASCLKSGKGQGECEGIAIATALKKIGSKRVMK